jgi:hypothetical protein
MRNKPPAAEAINWIAKLYKIGYRNKAPPPDAMLKKMQYCINGG